MAVLSLFLLPVASAAQSPYGPSPLSAADLLKRVAAACGHLEKGSYSEVLLSRRGTEASTRSIVYNGDDYRAISTTSPFTTADGEYKGTDWNQDESGIVTVETGFHLSEDPNLHALAHPSDTAGVTLLGVETAAPHRYVLDIHPPGGNHEVRYYDPVTFHLVRDETDEKDQRHHIETYDDFRTVFGSTRAFHVTISDGHAENDYDRTTASFVKSAPVELTIPKSRSLFSFPSAAPVVVPMLPIAKGIVVAAKIGDRTMNFMLDTGAATSSIDPDVAASLGLTQHGKHSVTVGGSYTYSTTMVPAMSLGGLPMTNVFMSTITIPPTLKTANIVGLLGHDVLGSAFTRIDFVAQTVTFYPPGAEPKLAGSDAIPIELDDYVPRAGATMDGLNGHFLIDTGAGVSLVFNSFALRDTAITYGRSNRSVQFLGGLVPAKVAYASDFALGATRMGLLRALVPQSTLAERDQYDGILGRDLLANYVLYFDYANARMYVRPRGE